MPVFEDRWFAYCILPNSLSNQPSKSKDLNVIIRTVKYHTEIQSFLNGVGKM